MHDRDRTAPIALAAQPPVAQAEFGDALAVAVDFRMSDGGCHAFVARLHRVPGKAAHIADLFGLHRHECLSQGGLV